MRMTSLNVDNVNMNEPKQSPDPDERRYHHGNLRAALIDAGLMALERSESGPLSLRAIARDVGVSANAAYRHFADKDALLRALAAEGFRRFARRQADTLGPEPRALTVESARAYVEFARQHPALFRLMFSGAVRAGEGDELQQAGVSAFKALLNASAREAGVEPTSDQALVIAIRHWSFVHGLSHLLLDGQLDSLGDRQHALIEQVLALARVPGHLI